MTNNPSPRVLSRVFSRPTFEALARGVSPDEVFKNVLQYDSLAGTVLELFRECFEILRVKYRNEYVYKTAIANRIVFGRHSPRTSSLAIELPVGRSIVDVAVFNGTSTAYEVKTELDTPRRLVTQTPDYVKAFDHVYIVTHEKLAEQYAAYCQKTVGILALSNRESLKVIRPATSNASSLEPRLLFRMLRRAEYVPVLKALGYNIDMPNGLIAAHCERLFSDLSTEKAHGIFLRAMQARTVHEEMTAFVSRLPDFLRVLGYASPLSFRQRSQLLSALSWRFH